MDLKRTCYAILEVAADASDEEITKSYRRLAKTIHPDKNHNLGAKEAFQELSHAYDTLKVPTSREAYDRSQGIIRSAGQEINSGSGSTTSNFPQPKTQGNPVDTEQMSYCQQLLFMYDAIQWATYCHDAKKHELASLKQQTVGLFGDITTLKLERSTLIMASITLSETANSSASSFLGSFQAAAASQRRSAEMRRQSEERSEIEIQLDIKGRRFGDIIGRIKTVEEEIKKLAADIVRMTNEYEQKHQL